MAWLKLPGVSIELAPQLSPAKLLELLATKHEAENAVTLPILEQDQLYLSPVWSGEREASSVLSASCGAPSSQHEVGECSRIPRSGLRSAQWGSRCASTFGPCASLLAQFRPAGPTRGCEQRSLPLRRHRRHTPATPWPARSTLDLTARNVHNPIATLTSRPRSGMERADSQRPVLSECVLQGRKLLETPETRCIHSLEP